MNGRRRSIFIVASLITWALLGLTGWGLFQHLETSCKRQEQHSGLWAECYAPAALIYAALFALVLVFDLIRIVLVLWAPKPEKE